MVPVWAISPGSSSVSSLWSVSFSLIVCFLIPIKLITIQVYESQPVSIILPDHVSFTVVEADAVVKGQTAASSYKPATLEKGIKTSVPPFIEVGDFITINTQDTSYVEKAKK